MLEKIERRGFKHLASLEATRQQLWTTMCQHDGIPSDSSFVVFSDDNPFAPFHDKLLKEIREARATFVPGGGYLGLRIVNGRAVA